MLDIFAYLCYNNYIIITRKGICMLFDKDTPIEYLNLKARTYNVFKRHGINAVRDILDLSDSDTIVMTGISPSVIKDLQVRLRSAIDSGVTDVIDVVLYDDSLEDHTVLYYASDGIPNGDYVLRFRDDRGELHPNLSIDDTALSFRIRNCLHQSGLHTLLDVVNAPYSFVKACRNMGCSSCQRLLEYINRHCVITVCDGDNILINNGNGIMIAYDVDDVSKLIYDDMKPLISDVITYDDVKTRVHNGFDILVSHAKSYSDITDVQQDRDFMSQLYHDPKIAASLHNAVLDLLKQRPDGFTIREFMDVLPTGLLTVYDINMIIHDLIDRHIIELFNTRYYFVYDSVFDYIERRSDKKWAKIVKDRVSGLTLAEVAEKYGITRERVRQIVSKAIREKPPTKEDRYIYWFKKYSLSKEDFTYLFETTNDVYLYMQTVYDHGSLPLREILNDQQINDVLKARVEMILNKDKINVMGAMISTSPSDILETIMKCKYSAAAGNIDDIKADYENVCSKYGLSGPRYIPCNMHAFESRLTRNDLKNVLISQGRCVRYYDMSAHDIASFMNHIDFMRYDNTCVSAYKIFADYNDMMQEYDIQNGYELHNFLRKSAKYLPDSIRSNIRFLRMPLLDIGNVDRHKQVEDIIRQYSPISQSDLAHIFAEKYGIDETSFLMNWLKDFWQYYADGLYTIDSGLFTAAEVDQLRSVFVNDFYFVEDMISLCRDAYPSIDTSKFDDRGLKQLGFRVYANYVISSKYKSAKDYFSRLFENKSVVDVSNMDHRFFGLVSLKQYAENSCRQYKNVEVMPRKYVPLEFTSFSRDDIDAFCKYIDSYDSIPYFNMHYLRKYISLPKVYDDSFSDWFYDSLLRDHGHVSSYVYESGPTMIFCRAKKYDPSDFIRYIVTQFGEVHIKTLMQYLNDSYGLTFSSQYIRTWVKRSDVKYDEDIKTLYIR